MEINGCINNKMDLYILIKQLMLKFQEIIIINLDKKYMLYAYGILLINI